MFLDTHDVSDVEQSGDIIRVNHEHFDLDIWIITYSDVDYTNTKYVIRYINSIVWVSIQTEENNIILYNTNSILKLFYEYLHQTLYKCLMSKVDTNIHKDVCLL